MTKMLSNYYDKAGEFDSKDPLAGFRGRFIRPESDLIYMDGNSLGMLPIDAAGAVEMVTGQEWGERLIRSWNESWWEMPERAGRSIASLIGAKPHEVIVCDSTSINLFKLVSAWLNSSSRRRVVVEAGIFPADLYILQGLIGSPGKGYELVLLESDREYLPSEETIEKSIDDETALLVLSHVSFRSGAMYNMERVGDIARRKGCAVLWDLCHSAGVVPLELNSCGVEMAVGCTYKYMNCGPGAPSFIYLREDLVSSLKSPLQGWFGDNNPFSFSPSYTPHSGIRRFMTGTPGIISMSTIEPSAAIIREAGLAPIRAKSVAMTSLFRQMAEEILIPEGFMHGSPADSEEMGSHYTLRHREGYRISRALADPSGGNRIVIPDFRPPDNLRFGFAPLYNTYTELVDVAAELHRIVTSGTWVNYENPGEIVT